MLHGTLVRNLTCTLTVNQILPFAARYARCVKSRFFVTVITIPVLQSRTAGKLCHACALRPYHPGQLRHLPHPRGAPLLQFVLTCCSEAERDQIHSGLSEVSNVVYRQANFITRAALLHFLREHGEVALRVAEQLSQNYYTAYEEIRTLGLATSPAEKFAKLLLSWDSGQTNGSKQIKLTLTHEEIAEMIGTTRETVSRLFSDFKKKQLLQLKGSNLVIRNKAALEKLVRS